METRLYCLPAIAGKGGRKIVSRLLGFFRGKSTNDIRDALLRLFLTLLYYFIENLNRSLSLPFFFSEKSSRKIHIVIPSSSK